MEANVILRTKQGFGDSFPIMTMEMGIVALLRAAWVAVTLPILVASVPSSRLNLFHELVLGFAKRGKIMPSSSHKFTVPQRFFSHFYALAVLWTTSLLVGTWFYAYKMAPLVSEPLQYSTIASQLTGGSRIFSLHKPHSAASKQIYRVWESVFLLLLMEAHVLRRLIETIYVFKYSPSARMHIFGYFTGIFFYTAAPLSLCCTFAPEAFIFAENQLAEFIVKGKNQISTTEFDWWVITSPLMKLRWYSWIGMAIFFWGWIHQCRSHAILGSLRENSEQADDYVVPDGDWFDYVSSPHYLAEIVIYGGLVVASGGSDLTIWLLFGFVVANLVFAAAETQRWYLRKFDNYPTNRFAIIPFVY
ncbi:Polyprenol reductase [Actinidia chinensis var. chinensis]|uniref:Polyprenol reductase n=1 Tax=Actinidia chinensis var. chinensis TaxID=1590841 RepID=A0A2R6R6U1_ACTCC|nr:Polyprenol reductase [Actinidia chinensis var. chinensis]